MTSAIENYRTDNGKYPSDPNTTEQLAPNASFDPTTYIASSEFLYRVLSGDPTENTAPPGVDEPKTYFDFQPKQIRTSKSGHKYIVDPFGNSYGYSTSKAAHLDSRVGYNPTFDLWSTGGGRSSADQQKWIKNW